MRNPWQEELAVIRAIEAERGDQGGHGRWLLFVPAAIAILGCPNLSGRVMTASLRAPSLAVEPPTATEENSLTVVDRTGCLLDR